MAPDGLNARAAAPVDAMHGQEALRPALGGNRALAQTYVTSGTRFDDWSFGGGTVLIRRYRHRLSQDVDVFVQGP